MSRKIILLGPCPPPYGGVATYMESLARHFPAAEYWHFPGAARLFWMLIKEGRGATILDSTSRMIEFPYPRFTPVWLILKRLLRFHWVRVLHSGALPPRYETFNSRQKALIQAAMRGVDEFVVVSEPLEDWLRSVLPVERPIHCVSSLMPFSTPIADTLPPDITRIFDTGTRRVCSIGQFTPEYGFIHIARVVELLRQSSEGQSADVRLILIDGAAHTDEVYKVAVLKDRPWITVLTNLPRSVVLRVLKQSDVFVRETQMEGYGLSRIEALWCGTPVIATPVGETRGMILADFGDIPALADRLKTVLFDGPPPDVEVWAETFRQEALNHLAALARILKTSYVE